MKLPSNLTKAALRAALKGAGPDARRSHAQAESMAVFADFKLSNLRVADFAEGSPFSALGYEPDDWKAYVEFDICHTLPGVWLGPVSSGDYIGFFGETLAGSHASLRHQQFNYRHQLKAYAAEGDKNGKRDHIIGCIVATAMDGKPFEGYWSPTNTKGKETCIKACAVVFKLADGVDDIMGAHVTSREAQSVSIEVTDKPDNLGVYRPSTNEMYPYLDIPDEWLAAVVAEKGKARPRIGTLDGEQLVVVYGGGGKPVQFRGVGMTPNPAEKFAGTSTAAAKITAVNCEELVSVTAEAVPDRLLCGRGVNFSTGRRGRIQKVFTEGKLAGFTASVADPVCRIALPNGQVYLPISRIAQNIV